MFVRISILAAAALSMATPGSTETRGDVNISVVVPEVCQIESSAITVDASGESASGTVFEMCNSDRGFRVIASHRALVGGEQVQINYDGEIRQLDSSGISDVAYRSGPVARNAPVEIQTTGLVQGLSVSLGLTVL